MLKKTNIKTLLFFISCMITLSNPQLVIQSVKNGMLICYNNVIPSLYLFMVIANYRAQPEIMNILSFPLKWYGRLLKTDDTFFSGSLVLSFIGGFAVGSNYINILSKRGYNKNELKVMSVAMINNSFAFTVFSVGVNYFGNAMCGVIIYASLILSSMITAFILSFIFEYNIVSYTQTEQIYTSNITDSIKKAVESILIICGFVILFNFICEVISLYTYHNKLFDVTTTILTEVTCGILKLFSIYGKNIYFICIALSIFPVCTLCQVYHFTQDKDIIKSLLISRIIHTPVSLLILSLLANLFPAAIYVSSDISPEVSLLSDSMETSAILFMITVVFLIIFEDNKLFTISKK